ncbi:TlpA family protein disulfide reductase [Deinococcus cellulosilyticus]|uniref:Cytochrome c biogenesis protein n=1 Tax=Deinococcus cellulosilyticus (strain DSM 18568 / NBRC 106333 / KACC 11606 / 5516J-15) TaxID=1223518 RepID=A0A511N175_DEIC1|nr:TlpA disulfide reductase family protein [Deinococcus cellulosilyticus]GEM46643.1 cytochrome c biogenesis protein [Deinococcus cellulosilyticus NBRC 106333 = KACC 11606]
MKRFIGPLLVVLVVALLGYGLLKEDRSPSSPLEGKAAPQFVLKSIEGQEYNLQKMQGKPVVINFWASWCLPCRAEAPVFRTLTQQAGDQVEFLGILFNDNPVKAQAFQEEFGLKLPILWDPGSRVAINYGIAQIPVTLILDQSGIVVYRRSGEVRLETMQEVLKNLGVNL